MKISDKGLRLIKKFEGLRLEPYLDIVGVPTIGYGNTYYENGTRVDLSDESITEAKAELMLKNILKYYEEGVNMYVKKDINQSQFDALVSFSYNLGVGALQKSTLLKKTNINPCDETIKHEFLRWVKAGGKILQGLVKRRKEEAALYFQEH